MEYRNYLLCNLPILREITNCDTRILEACKNEGILTEVNAAALKNQNMQLRNYNFWSFVMKEFGCWKKIIDIFYINGQRRVQEILQKGHRDDNGDQKYGFINHLKPLKVNVKKSQEAKFCDDDFYKLESPGIGLALIINITSYETCGMSRLGSKQDTNYLSELLSQIGYKIVTCGEKVNAKTLLNIIHKFLKAVFANQHNMSFIIYIGCNAENGNIILSDGDLAKKPKLIIVQAERSILKLKPLRNFFDDMKLQHTMTCYISEPKPHFELNVNIGSWCLYTMIDIFMREACIMDLESMLKEMEQNVFNLLGNETDQLLVLKNYGMKKLYFNVWNKENMEYYEYFRRHTPYLSAICRTSDCNMENIINKCVLEGVFSPDDTTNLLNSTRYDTATAFWKLISTKKDCMDILMDIFYHKKMFNVVDTLKRAKKDDGSDDKYRSIEDKKPLQVKLKRPPTNFSPKPISTYNLQEEFIGLALVINIIEYDMCGLRRHGAEYDTTYMTELWSQMGYKVMRYEGRIEKPHFLSIVNKLLRNIRSLNFGLKRVAQSCVVYIGCHGSEGKLVTSEEREIDFYEEIVLKFNKSCLNGMPKIFIVQCCQLPKRQSDQNAKFIQKRLSSMRDLILCFSTLRGEQSSRDSFVGSLYVYALTYVFMNNAYKMELQKMLHEVTLYMTTEFKFEEDYQMPYFETFKMKDLYFNIGQ